MLCVCHRQIGRTAYRLFAHKLTYKRSAICSPGLPFNGLHSRNPWITTQLPTPEVPTAELAWLFGP